MSVDDSPAARPRRRRRREDGADTPRRPSHRGRLLTAAGTVVALGVTGFALTRADGFEPTRYDVTPSSAWLPSFKVGQVALVDGATSDTLAKVDVVRGAARMAVVQSGSTAFVLNRETGTLTRVDGGTLDTVNASPFGSTASLQPFAGAGSLFVYDRVRGALATLDAQTMSVRRRTSLAPSANEYSAVVDGNGRLWVIAGNDGSVNRYDADGNRLSAQRVADPAKAQVALVQGRPVVIDSSGSASVHTLDAATGRFSSSTCLPGAGHRLWSTGSPTAPRVYFSDGTGGSLLVSDLARGSCDMFVEVAAPQSRLGPPLEVGDKVLVPDWTSSTVAIVDTRTWKVVKVKVPVPKNNAFDLVDTAGFVFYNDPNSEQAGVISLDGRITPTKKYDPTDAKGDLKGFRRPTPTASRSQATPTASASASATPTEELRRTLAPPESRAVAAARTSAPVGQTLQLYVDPPPSPELGKPYTFQVRAVGARHIASVTWSFGDGAQGAGLTVRHTYAQPRTYLVTALATFTDGLSDSATATIAVHAAPTVQIVSMRPGTAKEDVPTAFSASYRNGVPKTYEWKVFAPAPSGEIIATSSAAQPSFTFTEPTPDAGSPYKVTLVVDGNYAEGRALDVFVGPTRPSGVSVSCTPATPIAGTSVTCSATANGYVTGWEWTVTTPSGASATTTELPDLTLPAPDEGSYRVAVVAVNRTGRSDPGQVTFEAAKTTLTNVSCDPDPAFVGEQERCKLAFAGWATDFSNPTWQLLDAAGNAVSGQQTLEISWLAGEWISRFDTTFAQPGTYSLKVGYHDAFDDQHWLGGGRIAVFPARHTLTVTVPKGATVSAGGANVCNGPDTCSWVFGEGDQPLLRAAVDEGYDLTKWGGACQPAGDKDQCSLKILKDDVVDLTVSHRVTFTLDMSAPLDCSTSSVKAGFAAAEVAWRAEGTATSTDTPTETPTSDSPDPTTSKAEPTTTKPSPKPSPSPSCKPSKDKHVLLVTRDGQKQPTPCEIPVGSTSATCTFDGAEKSSWNINVVRGPVTFKTCPTSGGNGWFCRVENVMSDVTIKASW
ncbi:MAG: PKD domain-containing protein [Kineosporiaceae bacterium]